jgi:hypothetical protein
MPRAKLHERCLTAQRSLLRRRDQKQHPFEAIICWQARLIANNRKSWRGKLKNSLDDGLNQLKISAHHRLKTTCRYIPPLDSTIRGTE